MCGPSSNSSTDTFAETPNASPNAIQPSAPLGGSVNATPTTVIDPYNLDAALLAELIEKGINEERIKKGIPPLERDDNLMKAAKEKNDYQTIVGIPNEHQSETSTRSVVDKVNFYGSSYKLVGENTQYYGFTMQRLEGVFTILAPEYHKAAEDIVAKWIATPADYENIVNDIFTHAGTAVAWSDETKALFATQVFGGM